MRSPSPIRDRRPVTRVPSHSASGAACASPVHHAHIRAPFRCIAGASPRGGRRRALARRRRRLRGLMRLIALVAVDRPGRVGWCISCQCCRRSCVLLRRAELLGGGLETRYGAIAERQYGGDTDVRKIGVVESNSDRNEPHRGGPKHGTGHHTACRGARFRFGRRRPSGATAPSSCDDILARRRDVAQPGSAPALGAGGRRVQIRPSRPCPAGAGEILRMAQHQPSKLRVAGSRPVSRAPNILLGTGRQSRS